MNANITSQTKPSMLSGRFFTPQHETILLAEDDYEMRTLLAHRLRREKFKVECCEDGFELLLHIDPFPGESPDPPYDLIISDIRMPGFTGLEVLDFIRANGGSPPTILITAFGDDETHREAERLGVAAVMDKPFELDDLVDVVHRALSEKALRSSAQTERAFDDNYSGRSPFPDIVFRHCPRHVAWEEIIKTKARLLEPYREGVLFCRVVVTANNRFGGPERIELRGILAVPGKAFAAKVFPFSGAGHTDMDEAASELFAVLAGRLRAYRKRH